MDGMAREVGALEKELPKDAKLKRPRGKVLATDESECRNSATGNA
jgi:hypothetical protein